MSLCKSKQISNCCHPNALMTLMEYLQDYASPETKKVGLELIQKELENIPGEKIRKLTEEHLADIVNGLMAIPNLIALLGLTGVVVAETKRYFQHLSIRDAKLVAYKARHIGKK